MPRISSFLLLLSLLIGPLAGDVSGQTLEEKRALFEARVSSSLEPLNRKYVTALRRLEKEFALAKDYEGAIAVRDERLLVESMLSDTVVATDTANETTPGKSSEFTFSAAKALVFDGSNVAGDAVKMTGAKQGAEWVIKGVEPGGYEVVVTYATSGGGVVQAMEHFFRLSGDLPATGGDDVFKTISLGTLKITSRAEKLVISSNDATAASPLLIREVKLVSNRE
jgi:predicted secreted protein